MNSSDSSFISLLLNAKKSGRKLDVRYKGQISKRTILPLKIFKSSAYPGSLYLRAYSEQARDQRVFRLDKLTICLEDGLELTDSGPVSSIGNESGGTGENQSRPEGRPSCRTPGCKNLATLKETRHGKAIYRSVCSSCHRKRVAVDANVLPKPTMEHGSQFNTNDLALKTEVRRMDHEINEFEKSADIDQEFMSARYREMREKLLDFSRRNPLINFNHSESGVGYVRIVDELPEILLSKLVRGSMSFKPLPDTESDPPDELDSAFQGRVRELRLTDAAYLNLLGDEELRNTDPTAFEDAIAVAERALKDQVRVELNLPPLQRGARIDLRAHAKIHGINPEFELLPNANSSSHSDSLLQTLFVPDALDRRLRNIYSKYSTHLRETGINVLQIAFGFLEWTETKESDQRNLSPLLLLPLSMERKKTRTGYVYEITAEDDCPAFNTTLAEKLDKEFGLKVPEYSDEDQIETFWQKLESLFLEQSKWRLRRYVTIGAFPFSTILIYRDLFPESWGDQEICSHDAVAKLLGGRQSAETQFIEHVEDIDRLTINHEAPPLVVEADSSQHSAIYEVLKSNSLVIQGPPGTGKSQTITNLIAAAVSAGKKVLFVAEKQPALNVVSNRLKSVGLGPITFEPQRTGSKAPILDSIEERLALRVSFNQAEYVANKTALINQIGLSNRVKALLKSDTTFCEFTLFDLIWRFLKLRGLLPEDFLRNAPQVALPEVISHADLQTYKEYVSEAFRLRDIKEESCTATQLVGRVDLNEISMRQLQQDAGAVWSSLRSTADFRSYLAQKVGDLSLGDSVELINLLLSRKAPITTPLEELEFRELETTRMGRLLDHLIWLEKFRADYAQLTDEQLSNIGDLAQKLNLVVLNFGAISEREDELKRQTKALEKIGNGFRSVIGFEQSSVDTLIELSQFLLKFPEGDFKRVISIGVVVDSVLGLTNALEMKWGDLCSLKRRYSRLSLVKNLGEINKLVRANELKAYLKEYESAGLFSFISSSYRLAREKLSDLGLDTRDKVGVLTRGAELAEILICLEQLQDSFEEHEWISRLFSDIELEPGKYEDFKRSLQSVELYHEQLKTAYRSLFDKSTLTSVASVFASLTADSANYDDLKVMFGSSFNLAVDTLERKARLCSKISAAYEQVKAAGIDEINFQALWDAAEELSKDVLVPPDASASVHYWFSVFPEQTRKLCGLNRNENLAIIRADSEEEVRGIRAAIQILRGLSAFTDRSSGDDLLGALAAIEISPSAQGLSTLIRSVEFFVEKYDVERSEFLSMPAEDVNASMEDIVEMTPSALLDRFRLKRLSLAIDEEGLRSYFDTGFFAEVTTENDAFIGLEYLIVRNILGRFASDRSMELTDLTGTAIQRGIEQFNQVDNRLKKLEALKALQVGGSRPIPKGVGYGPKRDFTDLALIENELSKKKGHIPLRQLILRARDALLAMKPIWLMQPLSVSQFLPKSRELFDLVIIDEASQMLPEHAIASILRGAQIVVVGDDQQMPPSNLFHVSLDYAEDEAPEVESESILDLASQRLGNSISLRWHYRSKHPSLIQFSNHHFYNNRLEIVPSPTLGREALGVRSIKVEGAYKDGLNVKEAGRVIAEARDCMQKFPEKSLGIVTMNIKQKEFIEEELTRLADIDPVVRSYFERWGDDDLQYPFINNLERVQGDERDIIIISTVYGPDESGNMYQRFPLINTDHGHRRLNVLFTRARNSLILVTSMTPSQIKIDDLSSRGKRTLRDYIEYASTGKLELGEVTDKEPDSDFERFVIKMLSDAGYEAIPQVGVKGFSIDIGVKHPSYPYGFLAGIECDGATYHSSPFARDRDRIRQDILESLGWKIYRIWSTDWFADPTKESAKVLDWLKELRRPLMNA